MGETSTNIATLNMKQAIKINVKEGCEVDNPCDSNPCPQHSYCSDDWDSYSCVCDPGNPWPIPCIPCVQIGAGSLLHELIRRKTAAAAAGHFASPLKTSCCCFGAYLLILPLPVSIVFLWFVVPHWGCRHGLRIICSKQRFNQTERQFLVKGLFLCTSLSLLFCFFSSCFVLFFFLSQPFLLFGFSLTPSILIKILWMFSLF